MEIIKANYLEEVKQRKVETKARDLREEIAEKYIKYFNWMNDTLIEDTDNFWSATRTYWKSHTPAQFESIMSWAAKVGAHPKGIAKLLRSA